MERDHQVAGDSGGVECVWSTALLAEPIPTEDFYAHFNTVEAPFNKLSEKEFSPEAGMVEKINASLR